MLKGIESIENPSLALHPNVQELVEINAQLVDEKALLEKENKQLKTKYEALLEQIRLVQLQRRLYQPINHTDALKTIGYKFLLVKSDAVYLTSWQNFYAD